MSLGQIIAFSLLHFSVATGLLYMLGTLLPRALIFSG